MNGILDLLLTPITYVELALLLFLSVFISVLIREVLRTTREVARMSSLPLEEESLEPMLKPAKEMAR